MKLLTQKILNKEGLKQQLGAFTKSNCFSKIKLQQIPFSKTSYHMDQSVDMQSKNIELCLVYTLFQPRSTFILPKLDLKKSTKKQLNFSNSIFCSMWKTEQLFIVFFSLIVPKSTL